VVLCDLIFHGCFCPLGFLLLYHDLLFWGTWDKIIEKQLLYINNSYL
jgi:hypothetical protein